LYSGLTVIKIVFKIFIHWTSGGITSSGNQPTLSVSGARKQKRRRSWNGELLGSISPNVFAKQKVAGVWSSAKKLPFDFTNKVNG
jgi:hypothetical protein